MKLIYLRTREGVQQEIQVVAQTCLKIAEALLPVTVRAYQEVNGLSST